MSLILVRHGITSFNDNGGKGETAKEKFRGWLPIPLTLNGMLHAHDTAQLLRDIDGIAHIFCSDVSRAIQSAHEVGQALQMPIEPAMPLRDWNLGDFVGQRVEDVLDEVLDLIDHPSKPVKNGEPYQSFLDRAMPFIKKLVESKELNVAVTHARNIGLTKALAINNGKFPDQKTLKSKAPIHPSGIMVVDPDWEIPFIYPGVHPDEDK